MASAAAGVSRNAAPSAKSAADSQRRSQQSHHQILLTLAADGTGTGTADPSAPPPPLPAAQPSVTGRSSSDVDVAAEARKIGVESGQGGGAAMLVEPLAGDGERQAEQTLSESGSLEGGVDGAGSTSGGGTDTGGIYYSAVMTGYAVGKIPSTWVFGRLSDRVGLQKCMCVSLVGFAAVLAILGCQS